MNVAESRLEELLQTARRDEASEADIQSGVKSLFDALLGSASARLEVSVQGGSIDILVGNNVIVETKRSAERLGVAPGYTTIEQRRNYAATQLQEYVKARYGNVKSSESAFYGYTTNGEIWNRWEVRIDGEKPVLVYRRDLSQRALEAYETHGRNRIEIFQEFLQDLSADIGNRPSPPSDLGQLLADLPARVLDIARRSVGQPEFETKRKLWEDLMRGAFIVKPQNADQNIRLFADHSLLVEIARRVVQNLTMSNQKPPRSDQTSFSSWLIDASPDLGYGAHPEKMGLVSNLHREIDRYDWRLSGMDVLKDIYHSFIPAEVRHDFGEYYTPDWLAEAVCDQVMDDEWCQDSVRRAADPDDDLKGIGVIEPSCGSGTFLRAAVQRLIPFAEAITEDKTEQSNIICRLVHGLDIHPVAVELSRATMLSALPGYPSGGAGAINVFLTDSLRWILTTDLRIIDQGGLLIETPENDQGDQRFLHIPSTAIDLARFSELIDDLMFYSEKDEILGARLEGYGLKGADRVALLSSASTLSELKNEQRNHVWLWYIKNVAQAQRFHVKKFARMVGNPPWVTRRSLDRDRQKLHRQEAIRLGLWVGGATFATQNNYATVFAATVIRDYMVGNDRWKAGLVMPWSALRSEVWAPFRQGDWSKKSQADGQDEWYCDLSEPPWDLKGVNDRPFPQSDSCVVFIRRPSINRPIEMNPRVEEWRASGVSLITPWRQVRSQLHRRIRELQPSQPSSYLDQVRNGATVFPYGLVRVSREGLHSGGKGVTRFRTWPSTRGQWRNYQQFGEIEEEFVRQTIFSTDIADYRVINESYSILPTIKVLEAERPDLETVRYRFFGRYWFASDRIWRERRSRNSPETLFNRVDHLGELSFQLRSSAEFKLVYPSSGARMFGVKVNGSLVIEHKCYYIEMNYEPEADYLCAVLGAESLQEAFRESKPSPLDFGTYPLRTVPIPKFNPANQLHSELAKLGARAELIAASVPLSGGSTKMRGLIRDALREDGVSDEIDRCVRDLLPGYAV